jgi:L-alanine-DL-glutamate epimerase-like enolase superfamily enzyme
MKNSIIAKTKVSPLTARLTQPFRIASGQHDSLENVLFQIELKDGTRGYGEAAIATHITGETLEGTIRNLELAGDELAGRDISDYLKLSAEYGEKLAGNPCALAAVEMAVLDALTRQWKMPLWKFFGPRPRKLTTDITVVIGSVEESAEFARQSYAKGFRAFKIKVGKNPEEDLERILAVHKAIRNSPVYLDANMAFDANGMLRFLKELSKKGCRPVMIEQPVPKEDWEGLSQVSRESGITVLADEGVRSLADAVRIVRGRLAGGINIKLMKFGVFRSAEIARLARSAGLKLMIGCMMESVLAITAAAHLASGLGGFDYIDLDTPFFVRPSEGDRLNKHPINLSPSVRHLSANGIYDLRRMREGIGVMPKNRQ